MKTRYEYYMTDGTKMIYIENEIKLLWPIRSSMVCDENQKG